MSNNDIQQELSACREQLDTANREMETFAYSVSHDLRAPLRAIEGFARILSEDYASQLEPEAKHYLDVITTSAANMQRLMDDLLSFSRLTRAALEKRCLNMTDLAQSAVRQAVESDQNRQWDIAIHPVPPALGDLMLVRTALHHLVANAVKFTRDRNPSRIEFGCHPAENGSSEHTYWMRDNGVGFDMQFAGKLFGIFQRLHRADEFQGNGVGLASVQRIIHRHGGRVWTEASPGKGAVFFFTLPAVNPC